MIGETRVSEEDLLVFIDNYWDLWWTSPSYDQIGLFLGLSSKASVSYHLEKLIARGLLEKKLVPGSRRPLFRRA